MDPQDGKLPGHKASMMWRYRFVFMAAWMVLLLAFLGKPFTKLPALHYSTASGLIHSTADRLDQFQPLQNEPSVRLNNDTADLGPITNGPEHVDSNVNEPTDSSANESESSSSSSSSSSKTVSGEKANGSKLSDGSFDDESNDAPTVFEKPKDFKIIGLVFFGRPVTVAILDCYLRRNLARHGGFLDEIHWVANTKSEKDLEWLDGLIESEDSYRKIVPRAKGYDNIWRDAVKQGVMYIKIDDDLVCRSFFFSFCFFLLLRASC